MKKSYFKLVGGSLVCTAVCLFAALTGCGSDDSPGTTPSVGGAGGTAGGSGTAGAVDGGGGTAGKGGTAGGGGASGGTAGASGGGGSGGGTTEYKIGNVTLMNMPSKAYSMYSASASFVSGTIATSTCTTKEYGKCLAVTCDLQPISDAGTDASAEGGVEAAKNAGDITIKGAKDDPITLKADAATGLYTPVSGTKSAFDGGESLTCDAVGTADIPKFSGTVKAPKSPVMSAPALPAAPAKLEFTLASPPQFTWTGADSDVRITVTDLTATKSYSVLCTYAGADGQSNDDLKSAVADFDKSGTGTVSALAQNVTDLTAGGYTVHFTASSTVQDSNGVTFGGQVSFK